MRRLAIAVAWSWAAAATVAADGSADELQARGEQLAKDQRYTEAIDAFKAADKLAPSAAHGCFIALAYTRRELWPQAEIFMARCLAKRAGETIPEWVPEAQSLIAVRLAEANVAPVTIVVQPAGVGARVSVSSFAPDETFAPGTTIHLPPGHHAITVTAPGYEREERAIDVTDRAAKHVAIVLYKPGTRPKPIARPSRVPRALVVAGAASLGAGVAAYAVMGVGWVKLRQNDGVNFGTKYETMYDVGRVASIAALSVGAVLVTTGYLLHRRDRREAIVPLRGGAIAIVEWRR